MNKKAREYIVKLTGLAHDININTDHDVWIDMAGHVNQFTVRYHKNGWKEGEDETYRQEFYFDDGEIDEEKAKSMLEELRSLL